MARLVPPGEYAVPGLASIEIELITRDYKLTKRIRENFEKSHQVKIVKEIFYIQSLTMDFSRNKFTYAAVKLFPRFPEKFNALSIKKLEKYGEVKWTLDRQLMKYATTSSHVHHDYKKEVTLSKDKKVFARIWDIIPDKWKNEWEITIWKEKEEWCGSCEDEHTVQVTVHTFKFLTKRQALGKWANILKNKEKFNK